MNGQLSEQPLAELIREISSKSLGGRLRVEQDRVKVVAYFENGNFAYAASNLRTLRLREYLIKCELVSESDLAHFDDRVPDLQLLKELNAKKVVSANAAEQVQIRLVADVLRLALLWTEGTWAFDSRSRLEEQANLNIDIDSLLLDAARRLPADFVVTRFGSPDEIITPVAVLTISNNLIPAEVFLLSRLEQPMALRDLVAVTGLGETETLRLVYSLALAGVIQREQWNSVFSGQRPRPRPRPSVQPVTAPEPPAVEREQSREVDLKEVEVFLARVKTAQSHYEVLGVDRDVSAQSLKTIYYQLARRYHPDRFRKNEASLVTRLESAFARVKQAYDTLRDDGLRSSYNTKLQARKKAEEFAPKATTAAPQPEPVVEGVAAPAMSAAERAAIHAANGQRLAKSQKTRRGAETELLAAIKLDPQNAEYRVMLAELYRDLGLKLRAKGEAERAVATDPNNRKARDLLRALKSE